MPLLRDDPNLLAVAVAQTSEISNIPLDHVEKDFWLTECLRALATYGSSERLPILFKGGTSLSKAFGLIQRFSEDADLVVVFGAQSLMERDRQLKGFIAAAERATGLTADVDPSTSDRGKTRDAFLTYPGGASATPLVANRVKIELHTVGGVKPYVTRDLCSIMATHWSRIPAAPPASTYHELARFPIKVVEPCRTLVEKLVILHEAHTRDGGSAVKRMVDTVRHYYDVWCLLQDPTILAALAQEDVRLLAHDVLTYSQSRGYATASRPAAGFATSPAFAEPPTKAVRGAYANTLFKMLWPGSPCPELEECQATVVAHAAEL